ncbi:MAG: sensor domain-containing diguanylate cyclase [Peptostreptococcaceae bacterium]|nr:sensor domain-containing diguanylate cyclase [Peptostreptococcaceae bacterium]
MDREKYLHLNSDDLYDYFVFDVLTDHRRAKRLIEELSETERYEEDFVFRAHVQTARAMIFTIEEENEQVLSLCTTLADRCKALKLWRLLAANQNMIANLYYVFGVWERAIEYYYAVIKTEESHGLMEMTSTAYKNIASIYNILKADKKTYEYLTLAIDALKKGGSNQLRYRSKFILYMSDLIRVLCRMKRPEEAARALEDIRKIDRETVDSDAVHAFYSAELCHAFHIRDFSEAKGWYTQWRSLVPSSNIDKHAAILDEYIAYCQEFDLDTDLYAQELKEIDSMEFKGNPFMKKRIYASLRKYYLDIGDQQNLERITKKYIELLEEDIGGVRQKQLDSLLVVEGIIKNNENLIEAEARRTEFEMIADEAVRNRYALEETYRRIDVINQIGKQLTSSLNLSKVVELILQKLKENLRVDTFILMVAEPEKNQLRSVVNYVGGRLRKEFCLDIDNPNSVFADCYRTNRLIVSNDVSGDPDFKQRNLLHIGKGTRPSSVAFMPLQVEERLIGMFSIQAIEKNAYPPKQLAFLEELQPYLAIALNNAVRSWKLENEIEEHIETQERLKDANRKLDRLSSLDGLTQISNRRDFEQKVLDLFDEAKAECKSMTVFMFDIDDFKFYNDTYGHFEGDEALKKVAHTIRENIDSAGGLCARFGGEEFIAACSGLDMPESRQLAEKIRCDIFDLNLKNEKAPLKRLTISIGVSTTDAPDRTKKSYLLRNADIALYQAKNSGKNRVVIKRVVF